MPIIQILRRPFVLCLIYLSSFSFTQAQESLIFAIWHTKDYNSKLPYFTDFFYDNLTFGKNIRTTEYYGFQGKVQNVYQASIDSMAEGFPLEQQSWHFDQHGRILLYTQGDSVYDHTWKSEKYTYNTAGKLASLYVIEGSNHNFYSWKYFNEDGYLIEQIDSFMAYDDIVYHYQTHYRYDSTYTSIQVTYTPFTTLHWTCEDLSVDFQFDERGTYLRPGMTIQYDNNGRIVQYSLDNGCGRNSALCLSVSTAYDERGNVIEQIVDDRTTRNSLWSFSSHTKAKYNEQNLIIEREEIPFPENPIYDLVNQTLVGYETVVPTIYTYDYALDDFTNWVRLVQFVNGQYQSVIERHIEYYE